MEQVNITAGKLKGISRLADSEGRLRMLAVDQRGSLQTMLASAAGKDKKEIGYSELAFAKRLLTSVLSPHFSATLTDPEFGVPESLKYLSKNSALLVATEKSGTESAGYQGREKKTILLDGWSVEKIKKLGADAVKLLLYYRPDSSPEIKEFQENVVRSVGAECKKFDIPFVLEPVGFAFKDDEPSTDSVNFAKKKPEIVINIASEFSKEEYGVDILKLEFPVNLKFVKEFHRGFFDGKERDEVFSVKDAETACYQITKTSRVPWIILSAGVDIEEFVYNVEIASNNGASGYLAGRAVWKEFTKYFPVESDMVAWLQTSGVENARKILYASKNSTPYFEHKQFKSFANIAVANASADWYKQY
ncbi:MAG: tagatose 1,6-diphosphate aldolase [Caldisericaceae bacterium]